ncbi:MAG: radical SAM protein [Caldiserica bacterium]|nr:radical SAM protein [Caldisericota bacterium]
MKNSEILLVNLPAWGVDTPPLSLASISSFLQSRGINAKVLDLNVELYHRVPPERRKLWEMDYSHLWWEEDSFYNQIKPSLESEIEWAAERIMAENTDKVGFSVYAPNRFFSREVARIIKEKSQKILIAGGRGVYDVLERRNFPAGLIDYFVVGEGEEALYKFLKGEKSVEGIINDPEEVVEPVLLKNLQELPLLTYQGFDLAKYRDNAVCLLMNRGCIFKCAFCNDWRYIGKLRTRQAGEIYKEIEYHYQKNRIKKFYFNDQAINVNPAELNKLCDLLIAAPFRVEWIALAIPWKFLTYHLLRKMRQAGCITLNYGIESGSNRVLQLMKKKFSVEEAEKVLEDTRKAGINTQVNFIVGFPGETEEDFAKTAKFIERNVENISGITNLNMCNATLGSDLVVNREKYNVLLPEDTGKIDTHWVTKNRDNTPRIRLERVKQLIEKAETHGLHIFTTNLPRTLQDSTSSPNQGKGRILLVMCPMWDVSIPPLGIGYLSSYIESKGIPVDVLDINLETYVRSDSKRKNFWKMENYNLWAWEDLFKETKEHFAEDIEYYTEKIIEKGYRVIGFSLYGANILFSVEVAKRLKQKNPDLFIIFGGPSCSFLYEDPAMPLRFMISFKSSNYFAEPGVVDAFVIGEGEETTFRLINSHLSGNMYPVPGAIIYLNGQYTTPSHRPLIKNLAGLPFPAWEKFPLELYTGQNTLPILFSRGCVNRCTFCNDWKIWQGKYRYRPAYDIFQEIKTMHEKFNTRTFQCNDLMFNGSLKMLEELSEYLINAKLNIQWNVQGTIRREMSLPLLQKLRESGLNWITYGVESLSENVLEKMGKKYTFEDIQGMLKNTKKAGIGTSINFIVGFPGETEKILPLPGKGSPR